MRAKKLLLLSCLYPLVLFLIIGYTFSYSSQKAANSEQANKTIYSVSFLSPVPTTLVVPEKALVRHKDNLKSAITQKAEASVSASPVQLPPASTSFDAHVASESSTSTLIDNTTSIIIPTIEQSAVIIDRGLSVHTADNTTVNIR